MDNSLNEFAMAMPFYKKELDDIPQSIREKITDIRFCVGFKPSVYVGKEKYTLTACKPVTAMDMADMVFAMCDYSVYKHIDEIKQGFISFKEKYRVGLCGTAVQGDKGLVNIKKITSVTIRIPRDIENASNNLTDIIDNFYSGVLIMGEPSSGKTTILKDLIRYLKDERLTVVDQRWELSTSQKNVNSLYGYPKDIAISQAIRNLGSKIIICDELDEGDIESVKLCVSTGVSLIASVHGDSLQGNIRPIVQKLIATNAFSYIAKLKGRDEPCKVDKVWKVGELLERNRHYNYNSLL